MPRLGLILCTVFLDALGYGLIIPVLPGVVRRFGADPSFVSQLFGLFVASYAVVQLLAAPILGGLSDRFGRRPVLLVSLAGAAVDYVFMAYAPSLPLLFVGRVVSGVTGASMAVANAYVADISDEKSRPGRFGLMAAALGAGIVVGPAMGGVLGQLGPKVPFLTAAALNLVNLAGALLVLPESLATTSRRRQPFAHWNPLASLRHLWRASPLTPLFWCYLLVHMAGRATSSLWALFTEHRFGWSSFEIGTSLAFLGLIMAVAQATLPGPAIAGLGERRALRLGLLLSAATYIAIGLATRGWMLYVMIAASALAAIAGPVLQSLMSRGVSDDAQGELQGSLASVTSLTAIAGPLLYTSVFAKAVRGSSGASLAGAPFLVGAAFCAVAWVLVAGAGNADRSP